MAGYRVGIIGHTGRGDYGHGIDQPWQHLKQCEVVAVADPHEGGRQAAMKRSGAARGYADYRTMLDQEQLNIAVICPRWIDQHHAMCLAAAEHGCHIYMEKPFCQTLQQADEIVQACEMRHLKLAIAHVTRYSSTVRAVRHQLREGLIGDLIELRARGKEDPARGGGEDLWVLGSHMLDLMRVFAGDAVSCFATVLQNGAPVKTSDVRPGNEGIGPLAGDAVDALFRFSSGVTGTFSSRRGAGGPRFALRLLGTKGMIEMTSGHGTPGFFLNDPSWSPGRSGKNWQAVIADSNNSSGESVPNFTAALDLLTSIEADRQPVSGVYDARASVEMITSIFASQQSGTPVSLPLDDRSHPLSAA